MTEAINNLANKPTDQSEGRSGQPGLENGNPIAQGEQQVQSEQQDETQSSKALEKFDRKKEEHQEKVKQAFENRISGSKLDKQLAYGEAKFMEDKEMMAIGRIFSKYKKEYENATRNNQSLRTELAEKLLKQAEKEAAIHSQTIEAILSIGVKGTYLSPEEVAKIGPMFSAIENLSEQNKEQTTKILNKLKGHKELSSQDYEYIISILNPTDLTNKDNTPQQNFEASSAVIFIGAMDDLQRMILVERVIEAEKKGKTERGKTASVIDGFLRNGIVKVVQGEKLFRLAIDNGVISEEEFTRNYKGRLEGGAQGSYVEEAGKIQEALNKKIKRLKQDSVRNSFQNLVGSRLVGGVMGIHAVLWLMTQFFASGGDIAFLFNPKKNPLAYVALASGAVGLDLASSEHGLGSGWIGRALEMITETEGPQNSNQERAYKFIGETYLNYPDFGSYLKQGGAQSIAKIRHAKWLKGAKGSALAISYQELENFEKKANHQDQLYRLQNAQQKFPQAITKQINGIAEALNVVNIRDQTRFNDKLKIIEEQHGLSGEPSRAENHLLPSGQPTGTPEQPASPAQPVAPAEPGSDIDPGQPQMPGQPAPIMPRELEPPEEPGNLSPEGPVQPAEPIPGQMPPELLPEPTPALQGIPSKPTQPLSPESPP